MPRTFVYVTLALLLGVLLGSTSKPGLDVVRAQDQPQTSAPMLTPAMGYNVHVTAPHMVNGKAMGPFHHYCKTMSEEPKIVCLIYDDSNPNSMLTQVEWIWAKKITRPTVPLATWNKLWHDHAVEIAGGRVKVHDMPDEKAKEVADLVSTTDGLIYTFPMDAKGIPTGKITLAQAVGHKAMTMAEYKNFEKNKRESVTAGGGKERLR
jgi:hypothetical protein